MGGFLSWRTFGERHENFSYYPKSKRISSYTVVIGVPTVMYMKDLVVSIFILLVRTVNDTFKICLGWLQVERLMIPRVWGDDGSHNPLRCKMTPESASLVCCYAPRTRSHETAETAFLRLTELPRADETMLLLMLGGESVEMPEMLALQQLGCLREMMLREAQLLDSLSHHCVVPLEGGWLEQRTTGAKFFREHTCGASGGNGKRSSGREKGLDISTQKTAPCLGHQPAWCDSQKLCCGNAVDYFLRSCVPLTVSAEDGDTGEDSTFGRSWIDSPDGSSVHEDVLRQSQLPWGGDGNTDWRGTAEPKGANRAEFSAVDAVVSSTTPALPSSSLKRCGCTGAPHRQWNDQRSIRLTSYLLLPDWLPLRLWFEREFEPRVASDGNGGVRGIDAAVTASEDWASVWRQLSVMFLQVVSGVEFLHERGVVHNNLHLESVWVSERVIM